ncbi:hypothetical protein HMN09_01417200 [Mycena chlorophos]|uniref:Uncharacterized protein n=1 Tax=Mycena chlorophos TaxID=658473 RepID=A0A8H6RWX8_MYCCL|nr:hypothetical protein HMN09_01417200 [Mycena chlorophos]
MSVPSPPPPAQSGPSMKRYIIRSSDVVDQALVVNVLEETTDKNVWSKERFLTEDEIIDHLVVRARNACTLCPLTLVPSAQRLGRLCWTMHRPRSGWYIRLKSPAFPPNAFIPLQPAPPNGPHPSGSLVFASRTHAILSNPPPSVHSYPPSPPPAPAVAVEPPTADAIQPRLVQQLPRQAVTHFVLAPYQIDGGVKPDQLSLPSALNTIRTNTAGPDYSLHARPIALATEAAAAPPPLITFTGSYARDDLERDYWCAGSTGTEEQALGVDSSFWIAVALTYLEFLQERRSAAISAKFLQLTVFRVISRPSATDEFRIVEIKNSVDLKRSARPSHVPPTRKPNEMPPYEGGGYFIFEASSDEQQIVTTLYCSGYEQRAHSRIGE